MASTLQQFGRSQAAQLLETFRQARARGQVVEAMLIDGADWIHPSTEERIQQAEALEGALEALLASRAGRTTRRSDP